MGFQRISCFFGQHNYELVATDRTCGWLGEDNVTQTPIHISYYRCRCCGYRFAAPGRDADYLHSNVAARIQRWNLAGVLPEGAEIEGRREPAKIVVIQGGKK